jgi:tetratricopeptide (TPR) repeat protein
VTIQTATSSAGESAALTFRRALAAARAGRLEEACSLAEGALAAGGDPVPINALLGMVRLDLGQYERALPHLEFAHVQRPSDIKIATDLAGALTALERFEHVLEIVTRELAFADPTLHLARLRGAVAIELDDVAAAIEVLRHVLAAAPNDWESWSNLGNALRLAGDFDGSADAFERALLINPKSPEIRMNYAAVLRQQSRHEEAEGVYRELAEEFPENAQPLRELFMLLKDTRRDRPALEVIEAAIARAPDNVDLLLDKANHLTALQRMDDAEAVYRRALELDPLHAAAFAGLALVNELANRAANLQPLADEAEQRGVTEAANFIRAYHYRRMKEFDAGLAALENVPHELEPARQLHLRGQLLEGAGRYDEAFAAFAEMNKRFREDTSQPEVRATTYRDMIRFFHKTATAEWAHGWRAEESPDGRPAPVFLVGFPRSGTTLLDTMLMSHPELEVLEEEPALQTAMDLLPSFAGLPSIPDSQIKAARDLYFDTAASLGRLQPGKRLVDKNPLTINLLPFVRRLFPEARIILALRHPCDVVLSCFMANFRLNEGMSSFIRLDTAAELYDLSFGYFEHVQSLIPMPTQRVVYESIIADRETELRKLFDFLGLDWHDAVLDHQETAKKRGRIKTASYAQVVEPIYTRSAGRWQHYRKHLEPVFPVLAPWVEKFGYTL